MWAHTGREADVALPALQPRRQKGGAGHTGSGRGGQSRETPGRGGQSCLGAARRAAHPWEAVPVEWCSPAQTWGAFVWVLVGSLLTSPTCHQTTAVEGLWKDARPHPVQGAGPPRGQDQGDPELWAGARLPEPRAAQLASNSGARGPPVSALVRVVHRSGSSALLCTF